VLSEVSQHENSVIQNAVVDKYLSNDFIITWFTDKIFAVATPKKHIMIEYMHLKKARIKMSWQNAFAHK